ncbi:autotransporter outer membrane beta-barrel domain-containing protein [Campylobacter sp. RM12637]|uniref:autotransporter outer membrane beta-barrel domain-containing protein n=1 Tax=Campylobacter sp. RM12637 TaxID=2735734 RepID=UPI0030156A32|nr:autotransporter outer membrane beta-barrel domain-containing protein [Campylobacter sp. RM12637]
MLGGGILKLSLAASALIFSQGLIADEPQPTNENTQLVTSKETTNPIGTPTAENDQDGEVTTPENDQDGEVTTPESDQNGEVTTPESGQIGTPTAENDQDGEVTIPEKVETPEKGEKQDSSVDTKDPDEPKKEGQVDENQKDEASKEDGLKAEDTPKVDEAPKAEDKKEEVKEPEASKEDTNKEDANKGEEDSKKDEATKPTKPDVSTPAVPEKSPEEVKKEQLIKQTEEIVKNLGNLGNMAKDKVNELVTILVDSGVSDLATFNANKLDATTKAKVQTAANAIATKVIDNEKSNITSNALGAFNVQINNMNKRLGEIRGLNSDIGTWFRAYGGRFSDSSNHINFYSTQFGADKMSNLSDADVITGAMIGFDKVNADTKANGFNIGVYGSYIHNNGLFVDSVLKYANTSFKKTGVEFKKQNSVLLSVEGGYRAKINEKAYVEPSLEIITGRVGKYEAKSKANTISVKSFTPIMIKPQVYTGIEHKDFVFRAGVGAVVNAKKQEADIVINNIVNGIDAKAKTKLNSNNHGFASVGGSYKVNDNLRINLGVEKSFGSKFKKDYEVNAVIRYTF